MMFASLGEKAPATAAIDTTIAKEEELLRINDIAKIMLVLNMRRLSYMQIATMTQTHRQLYTYAQR
jgi:hypothetical protein